MDHFRFLARFAFLWVLVGPVAHPAQANGVTGKAAARKYFSARQKTQTTTTDRQVANNPGYSNAPRYLALHLGSFVANNMYF